MNGLIKRVHVRHTGYNAFDNDPWIIRVVDFVKAVLAQDRVKFIGVCWGHQILGRALGAKVAKSESGAWEVSVCQVINTEKGKELFGGKDALVSGCGFFFGFPNWKIWKMIMCDLGTDC